MNVAVKTTVLVVKMFASDTETCRGNRVELRDDQLLDFERELEEGEDASACE